MTEQTNRLVLKHVRLSHPYLFQPTAYKAGDPLKYKAASLMPKNHPAVKMIKDTMLRVAEAKWPGKGAKVMKSIENNVNKCSFQDGDNKPDSDGYPENYYLNATNKVKPKVKDLDGKTDLTENSGRPYAGCYVNVVVDIFASENTGPGVYASLVGVQFVKDGEAFGGGAPLSEDTFDDMSDLGGDTEDPLS